MFRLAAIAPLAALLLASACTPTTTTTIIGGFPEHRTTDRCFTGGPVLTVVPVVPSGEGRVLAMTQLANRNGQLESVCRLNTAGDIRQGYQVYSGEVHGGNAGLCVSARMSSGNHILSCASAAQVREAMARPLGSSGNTIRLTSWTPYPGS